MACFLLPLKKKQGYTRDNSSSFPLCLVRGAAPPLTPQKNGAFAMRTKAIIIRCTEEEHAILNGKKERSELARWLRELGLNHGETSSHSSVFFQPEVVRNLVGIGRNLNQVTRNINAAVKTGELGQIDALHLLLEIEATQQALSSIYEALREVKKS